MRLLSSNVTQIMPTCDRLWVDNLCVLARLDAEMKEISLSNGMVALVDDRDHWLVRPFTWWAWQHRSTWYAVTDVKDASGKRRRLYMHRMICGSPRQVDHRDGNGLNNCRSNLRPCSHAENQRNQRPQRGRSSRFKGVYWNKKLGKWVAAIKRDGHRRHLGVFSDEREAARAYDSSARDLFGEFAYLNFRVAA